MNEERSSLNKNQTWELIQKPVNKKALGVNGYIESMKVYLDLNHKDLELTKNSMK